MTALKILGKLWIPLVIVTVVGVTAFSVSRVHGFFGSQKPELYADGSSDDATPFNPKQLTYEIFGPAGTVADIDYFDVNAQPRRVDGAHLPWSLEIKSTSASLTGNIVAQGDSNRLGCRIIVDGVIKAERISQEVNAYTFCIVKSA